jgi:2-polyprenyl-3-methyl-5-hydroxy-6-metoxy-1,4-benzoquinol methylase
VRRIDNQAIKAHADRRFRTEYDYALFEYFRSAKVLAFLDQAGVTPRGRILDAGCGGGGMPLSLAEECSSVVAIDLVDRFRDAGTRLAVEKNLTNLDFLQADGTALPFAARAFDAVLSHAVIEHVADADAYLRECHRVLKPGGWMYLSTAPYLSFAGAHLPRLKVPVPLHLLLGRTISFNLFRGLARHAPWTLREPADQNSFIKAARRNGIKHDDLLELVRVRRLRGQIARAGFKVLREELHLTGTFRRLPGPLPALLRNSPLTQDIVIGNMEYVLTHGQPVQA